MRRSTTVLTSLVLGVFLFAAVPVTAVGAVTPRMPDLGMGPLRDFVIVRPPGARLLRFTTEIVNVGTGPFEVTGRRASTLNRTMTVWQRVYNDDGSSTSGRTAATMSYSGDDHDHWHVNNLERYSIRPVGSRDVVRGAKVGFCFWDTSRYRLSLPEAPQERVYGSEACGATPQSLETTMGLSVGWSDVYPWSVAYQWIDISGLPDGDYVVLAQADPYVQFTEATVANNTTWTRVRIAANDQVTILQQGPAA
jgi:hypothetical protein